MKILRTLSLLLGALTCAAGFAKDGTPRTAEELCKEVVEKRPDGYVEVATMQMLDTMKGRKNMVEWTCYAHYDADADKPKYRTTAWLEAVIKRAPGETPGIDLFDIGAQHRSAIIKLRVTPRSPDHRLVVVRIDHQGTAQETEVEISQESTDTAGFYCIKPGVKYRLKSKEKGIRLEVYYPAHLPGRAGIKQHEDGGPPSIPPVNEN